MKKILVGSLIPIVLAGIGFIYLKMSIPEDDIWSHENRNMLYETFSPNGQLKIGAYNYDMGALGYTSVQVSVVDADENYPIGGNLLRDQYIESVKWTSDNQAEFSLRNKSKLDAKVLIWVE
ncbi:MAG: hypothetical protein R6W86_09385 [Marinobacter sp.]|uniref:hypothetical protein n=1 Tax=Marinobacter sp. TaxID=50741 RepID=UPI00396EC63A